MTSRAPFTRLLSRVELDVADERDELLVQIVDSKIAFRGFRWIVHDDSASGVEPVDLDVAVRLRG